MPLGALLLALLAGRPLASRPGLAELGGDLGVDSGPSGSFTLTQYNMLMFSQFAAYPQLMQWPEITSGGKTRGGRKFGDRMIKWTFDRSKRMFSTDAYCVNQGPSRVNTACFYGAAGKPLQHILMFRSVGMKRGPDGTATPVSQEPDAQSYTDAWINVYCGITDDENKPGMAAQVDLQTQTFTRINVAEDIADKNGIKTEADVAAFVEEHAQVCRHLREHRREYEAMTPDIRSRQNRVAEALLKVPSDALLVNEASRDLCGNERWPHGVFRDMRWKMQKELAPDLPGSGGDELSGYGAFPFWASQIPYVESDKCTELRSYSLYESVYLTRYADRQLQYEDGEGLLTKDKPMKQGFLPRDAYHADRQESLTGDTSNPSRLQIPVDDHVGVWRMISSKSFGMHVMLATTHLYKEPNNPEMEEIRRREIAYIVREVELQAESQCGASCLIVIGGDFNSEPARETGLHREGFKKNKNAPTVWQFMLKSGYRSVYQDFMESLDSEGRRHLDHFATSITPQRKTLIDHIFYKRIGESVSSGAVKAVLLRPSIADVEPLWSKSLPNSNSPSDHLPVTVEFQYWSQP